MASGTFYGETLAEALEEIFGEIGIK